MRDAGEPGAGAYGALEDRLRRLAALRDDPEDLATHAVAEIDRLRAEIGLLRKRGTGSGEAG